MTNVSIIKFPLNGLNKWQAESLVERIEGLILQKNETVHLDLLGNCYRLVFRVSPNRTNLRNELLEEIFIS